MSIRELKRDPDKNERTFVDEDPDDPDKTALLHLDDDEGVLTCHRCRVSRKISFACIHIEHTRDHLYR